MVGYRVIIFGIEHDGRVLHQLKEKNTATMIVRSVIVVRFVNFRSSAHERIFYRDQDKIQQVEDVIASWLLSCCAQMKKSKRYLTFYWKKNFIMTNLQQKLFSKYNITQHTNKLIFQIIKQQSQEKHKNFKCCCKTNIFPNFFKQKKY